MIRSTKGTQTVSGDYWQLTIEFNYFPGDPGQTSGPPERCWPPESPEFEFLSVKLATRKEVGGPWTDTGIDLLAIGFIFDWGMGERLEEDCLQALEDARQDFPEPDDREPIYG